MSRVIEIEVLKSVLAALDGVTPFEQRARLLATAIVFYGCEDAVAKHIVQSAAAMQEMSKAVHRG
jgi:hypothetical protein